MVIGTAGERARKLSTLVTIKLADNAYVVETVENALASAEGRADGAPAIGVATNNYVKLKFVDQHGMPVQFKRDEAAPLPVSLSAPIGVQLSRQQQLQREAEVRNQISVSLSGSLSSTTHPTSPPLAAARPLWEGVPPPHPPEYYITNREPSMLADTFSKKKGNEWAVRWLVLEPSQKVVWYYKKSNDSKPARQIELYKGTVVVNGVDSSTKEWYMIELTYHDLQVMILRTADAAKRDKWVERLSSLLPTSARPHLTLRKSMKLLTVNTVTTNHELRAKFMANLLNHIVAPKMRILTLEDPAAAQAYALLMSTLYGRVGAEGTSHTESQWGAVLHSASHLVHLDELTMSADEISGSRALKMELLYVIMAHFLLGQNGAMKTWLLHWCKTYLSSSSCTDYNLFLGYQLVDFSLGLSDGMIFCCILHCYDNKSIDLTLVTKDNALGIAARTACTMLHVPPLVCGTLQDEVQCAPDEVTLLLYLALLRVAVDPTLARQKAILLPARPPQSASPPSPLSLAEESPPPSPSSSPSPHSSPRSPKVQPQRPRQVQPQQPAFLRRSAVASTLRVAALLTRASARSLQSQQPTSTPTIEVLISLEQQPEQPYVVEVQAHVSAVIAAVLAKQHCCTAADAASEALQYTLYMQLAPSQEVVLDRDAVLSQVGEDADSFVCRRSSEFAAKPSSTRAAASGAAPRPSSSPPPTTDQDAAVLNTALDE
eukprot:TRINITY_DN5173_c0_g2_i1.p1 TRINITY_DN5173_c0_g2~~TRINITY_DN5173_c0_g2_i1.p1  ORF type:complete len:790 (+),score=211.62 TRINITY_DN5173_c0_g2_i1:227-2371(+)